jgi:hypothetical protein
MSEEHQNNATTNRSVDQQQDCSPAELSHSELIRLIGEIDGIDLWRNYPEWPSTFGPCLSPECDGCGRGSGFCAKCVTGGIADIVGSSDNAEAMRRVIEDARQTANKLREMVSPHNASDQRPRL